MKISEILFLLSLFYLFIMIEIKEIKIIIKNVFIINKK